MPRDKWESLEADLLRAGFTLGADYPARLDLRAILRFWEHAVPGSAVYRQENGVRSGWGYTEEILTLILKAVQDGNWQRAGIKTAPKPVRLNRPGEEPEGTQHITGEAMTIAEFEKRWKAA